MSDDVITVGDLKRMLEGLDDRMPVTVAHINIGTETIESIICLTAAGILHCDREEFDTLCMTTSWAGQDITSMVRQTKSTNLEGISCVKLLR